MLLLVLMVKNESRILRRCLHSAAPFVDAIFVVDTGSSDSTVAVAEAFMEKPTAVGHCEWRDFGWSRTRTLELARQHVDNLGWSLSDSYALVLDADMMLQGDPQKLHAALQSCSGAMLRQGSACLEYYNTRLMRLSEPWVCCGVTHEYWTGGQGACIEIPPAVCSINDIGDGGCKDDKLDRDLRLLLQGLSDEPDNVRYLFYLAQTYHCQGRHAEAQYWYLRRIEAGGWLEEVFYSHYMIVVGLLARGRVDEAEHWVAKAAALQNDRVEPRMALVTYYRERSEHSKAWAHLLIAEGVVKPESRLFLETDAYGSRRVFERSILSFYMDSDLDAGMDACLAYDGPCVHVVLSNLHFYAQRLPLSAVQRLDFPTPAGFASSSIAFSEDRLVVRAVNYHLRDDGGYALPHGYVETRNFHSRWDGASWHGFEELPPPTAPRRDGELIRGLEDVRCCAGAYTATTRDFSYCDCNRMAYWRDGGGFWIVRPPRETDCEKNWLPTPDGRVIYGWHPLELGMVVPESEQIATLRIEATRSTPRCFQHYRGSAPPFLLGDEYWALVHVVSPCVPRHYLHAWVVMDTAWNVKATSRPFWLWHRGIEYCIGAQPLAHGRGIGLFFSVWDRESWYAEVSVKHCRSILRPV